MEWGGEERGVFLKKKYFFFNRQTYIVVHREVTLPKTFKAAGNLGKMKW